MVRKNLSKVTPVSEQWAVQFFRRPDNPWGDPSKIHIEFYDRRYAKHDGGDWDKGQPVSTYYVDTLLEDHPVGRALSLYGDVPSWTVPANVMDKVLELCFAANILYKED